MTQLGRLATALVLALTSSMATYRLRGPGLLVHVEEGKGYYFVKYFAVKSHALGLSAWFVEGMYPHHGVSGYDEGLLFGLQS